MIPLEQIQIRDPFVLPEPEKGVYYLYGSTDTDIWTAPATGFDVYRSTDLALWEGPIAAFRPPAGFWSDRNFWAPEVYRHGDRWYMFATFKAEGVRRGTQVLVADAPIGPFVPHSDGPVTPNEWECLDGTLFLADDQTAWMVFCHEWVQIGDGSINAVPLTDDLRAAAGEVVTLFHASEAPWVEPIRDGPYYVTDGPFVFRPHTGRRAKGGARAASLHLLWSSFCDGRYAIGLSTADRLTGPWKHNPEPIYSADAGHGMVFESFEGGLYVATHSPNKTPYERARFIPLAQSGMRLQAE